MAQTAGHDINYISIAGVLGAIARSGERPLAPLNLVGDYGGGGMMLAFGVVCGILEARTSGEGQVVDASMVEGTAVLTTIVHAMRSGGMWNGEPGTNLLDSGAPFYEVYEASDGGHVAVGAIEPQFYAELLRLMELDPTAFPQFDQARWPEFKERFAEVFKTRTRDEWAALLEPAEACSTAVPAIAEAPSHPHNVARKVFVEVDGVVQPAPAPRFSRTAPEIRHGAHDPGADTDTALAAWGLGESEIADLRAAGAVS
jgi:alpha-methylacyl-CoA racemase